MKKAMLYVLERVAMSVLVALLVIAFLLVAKPWQNDTVSSAELESAIVAHAEAPLDCNQLIIRRWETPDGTEVLAPEIIPLWQYIQEPDQSNETRESSFRSAFERDLHNGDLTFHLTHEEIDGKQW